MIDAIENIEANSNTELKDSNTKLKNSSSGDNINKKNNKINKTNKTNNNKTNNTHKSKKSNSNGKLRRGVKRKRIKFGKLEVANEVIKLDRYKKLNFIILEPFQKHSSLNFYYIKLAYLLEEGTNKLVFTGVDGKQIAITKAALYDYLGITKQRFHTIFERMCFNKIIMECRLGGCKNYYMNPKFVVSGDYYNKFLLDMFEVDQTKILGFSNCDIKGSRYEKITTEKIDITPGAVNGK